MNSFFNMNNGLFTFLSKACDVMILSLVWFVCCLPIFTIGPATTALYYTSVKVLRGDRGYLMKEYFRSFKLNFKRGVIIGLLLLLAGLILGVDIYMTTHTNIVDDKTNSILNGVYIALGILILSISIYIFPLLSRFDMTVKQLFRAAAVMAIRHLPSTVGMLVILVGAAVGTTYMIFTIAIFPALVALIDSLFLERIFKMYMPKDESVDEAEVVDENGNELHSVDLSTDESTK